MIQSSVQKPNLLLPRRLHTPSLSAHGFFTFFVQLHVPAFAPRLHRACVKEGMEHSSKGNGTHQMELIKKEHLLKEHSSKGTLIIKME